MVPRRWERKEINCLILLIIFQHLEMRISSFRTVRPVDERDGGEDREKEEEVADVSETEDSGLILRHGSA